jgi:hypothetical protein
VLEEFLCTIVGMVLVAEQCNVRVLSLITQITLMAKRMMIQA